MDFEASGYERPVEYPTARMQVDTVTVVYNINTL